MARTKKSIAKHRRRSPLSWQPAKKSQRLTQREIDNAVQQAYLEVGTIPFTQCRDKHPFIRVAVSRRSSREKLPDTAARSPEMNQYYRNLVERYPTDLPQSVCYDIAEQLNITARAVKKRYNRNKKKKTTQEQILWDKFYKHIRSVVREVSAKNQAWIPSNHRMEDVARLYNMTLADIVPHFHAVVEEMRAKELPQ